MLAQVSGDFCSSAGTQPLTAVREAARMRVLRAKQAASRMEQQELLAKLMFMEEEKKILEHHLKTHR